MSELLVLIELCRGDVTEACISAVCTLLHNTRGCHLAADAAAHRGSVNCSHAEHEVNHKHSSILFLAEEVARGRAQPTHSGGGAGLEAVIAEAAEEGSLAHAGVPHQHDLEEAVRA